MRRNHGDSRICTVTQTGAAVKSVVIFSVTVIAVAIAAAICVRDSQQRAAFLEQQHAQNQQLMRHLDELEQRLALVESRKVSPVGVSTTVASASSAATGKLPAASPEKTPEHEQSIKESNNIVDTAIQSGTWTRNDLMQFTLASRYLSGEESAAIMSRMSAAINADQVKIDFRRHAP